MGFVMPIQIEAYIRDESILLKILPGFWHFGYNQVLRLASACSQGGRSMTERTQMETRNPDIDGKGATLWRFER